MPRSASARGKEDGAAEREISLLLDLAHEQAAGTMARARESTNGSAVTYIGKGDHLVLLSVQAGKVKTYVCRVLDVREESSSSAFRQRSGS